MSSDERLLSIPSHHKLAWPTLLVMRKVGRPVHNTEVLEGVAKLLDLSPELIAEPLGRGRRTRLEYKLSWARTLLKGIDAIENVEPAVWSVTARGQEVTEADISEVTQAMLKKLVSGKPPQATS